MSPKTFHAIRISKRALMFKTNHFKIKDMLQIPNPSLKAGCDKKSQPLPKKF